MLLSRPSLEDLRWWVSSTLHEHNSQDITPPLFDLTIRTDASLLSWGATCNGMSTGGTLERGGGRTTHQLFGTQGSHSSFEGFPESRHAATTPESGTPSPTPYPSGNGQYNCCLLFEQEGGTHSPSLSLLALELWSFLLTLLTQPVTYRGC